MSQPQTFSQRIFVLEDDPIYRRMLEYILRLDPDAECYFFTNGKDCLQKLNVNKPDVLILDYSLPDMNGREVLKEVKKASPDTSVVVLSGQTDVSIAIQMLQMGAYDYIVKDENAKDRMLSVLQHVKQNIGLKREVADLKQALGQRYDIHNLLIGESEAMLRINELILKAAQTDITVSITGETGTGKEVVAQAIHYNSKRKDKPFIAVNLAAIPKDLLESELFGHEKGAFTGAVARRKGKFEQADKGALFLDEIGEMELNLQAKLLRVLQEREFSRVGGESVLKIDTRIVVATNRDLAAEVKKGNFREDLYYRILGFPIHIPPLRERDNDVIILANYFIENFCKQNGLKTRLLSQAAAEKLHKHSFPGNVRELKAVVELACVLANDVNVRADDIKLSAERKENDFFAEDATLKDYTFKIIRYFLKKYDQDVLKVAEVLDVGKSTIYRYLKEEPGLRSD